MDGFIPPRWSYGTSCKQFAQSASRCGTRKASAGRHVMNIMHEAGAAVANMSSRGAGSLLAHDVPESAFNAGAMLCGWDRVVIDGDHYQPHPNGEPAVIAIVGRRGPGNVVWTDVYDL